MALDYYIDDTFIADPPELVTVISPYACTPIFANRKIYDEATYGSEAAALAAAGTDLTALKAQPGHGGARHGIHSHAH